MVWFKTSLESCREYSDDFIEHWDKCEVLPSDTKSLHAPALPDFLLLFQARSSPSQWSPGFSPLSKATSALGLCPPVSLPRPAIIVPATSHRTSGPPFPSYGSYSAHFMLRSHLFVCLSLSPLWDAGPPSQDLIGFFDHL